jgi:hypothetical protein
MWFDSKAADHAVPVINSFRGDALFLLVKILVG